MSSGEDSGGEGSQPPSPLGERVPMTPGTSGKSQQATPCGVQPLARDLIGIQLAQGESVRAARLAARLEKKKLSLEEIKQRKRAAHNERVRVAREEVRARDRHTTVGTTERCSTADTAAVAKEVTKVEEPAPTTAARTEQAGWDGDVSKATDNLVTQVGTSLRSTGELAASLLGALAEGAYANKLRLSAAELGSDADYPTTSTGGVTGPATARKEQTWGRKPSSSEEVTGQRSPRDRPENRPSLGSAADAMARKISGDRLLFIRLKGFLAAGVRNAAFCSAVCARLTRLIKVGDLRRTGAGMDEADVLWASVQLWVLKSVGVGEEEGREASDAEKARAASGHSSVEAIARVEALEMERTEKVDRCVVGAGALNKIRPLASPLLSGRVCPICVIQKISGATPHEVLEEVSSHEYTFEDTVMALKIGSAAGLEMLARAHNREMHALNGNISYIAGGVAPCSGVMADTLARGERSVKHMHVAGVNMEVMLDVAADEVPKLNYAVNVCQGTTLVAPPPTRHQLYWRTTGDRVAPRQAILDPDAAEEVNIRLEGP